MKRFRYWRGVLLSLGIIATAMMFLLYSETGLRIGVSLLTDTVLKSLTIAKVEGRLAGPLTLSGIEYRDTQHHLTLDKLAMDWQPASLLTTTLHITTLTLKGIAYNQSKSDTAEEKAAMIALPQITFPLRVIIDDASIDGIALHSPDRPEPINISQLSLKAETVRDTLVVQALKLSSDWLEFDLKGTLRPQQNYPLDLTMGWRVPQQGKAPWQGQGTLKGNSKKLVIEQNLNAPVKAVLALQANDLLNLDKLTWSGTLEIAHLDSRQLPFPVSPSFSIGGTLKANGKIDSFDSSTLFSGNVESIGAITGNLDAGYSKQRLEISRLELRRKQDKALVTAKGDVELGKPLRYQFETRWESLSWPLKAPVIQSDSGRLVSRGEDKQIHFDGDFLLSGPQIPKGEWRLQGDGNSNTLRIRSLEGKTLDGMVTADGEVKLKPTLQWQGAVKGRDLNPAVMWPDWPGQLSLDARSTGQRAGQSLAMDVVLSSVSGTLRDRKLQGHSEASWNNKSALLKTLELQIGSAHLEAQGKLNNEVDFNWQLEAASLSDLLPQAKGSLKSQGHISGPRSLPRLEAKVEGKSLSFAEYQVNQVQADIDLDRQDRNPSRILLQLKQVDLPGIPRQSVSLNIQGPLTAHELTLTSRSTHQTLTLNATAGYQPGRWDGKISNLQIDDTQLGKWKLERDASYSISATAVTVEQFCLSHDDANLCAQADWERKAGMNSSFSSNHFPLQLFSPYLPKRFGIEGLLDAQAKLALAPGQTPQVTSRLTIGEGRFHLLDPESETEVMALPFHGVDIKLDTDSASRLDGTLLLSLNKEDQVNLNLQTSMAKGWPDSIRQQPLRGRLRLSLQELAFISGLLPEVQNVQGRLTADISMSGTLLDPQLRGNAQLEQGAMDVSRVGLSLSALALTATGDNTRRLKISGKAHSGEGELTLTGQLIPTVKGPWSLELAMVGQNFEIADIPEARVQVSPDLKIRIVGREIHLDGNLDIPSARLEPRDLRLAVKTSDDVVIVGEETSETEREIWLIHTRIRMTAADSIRFIGYGFDGRIGGELLLIDEPGSLTRGRGVLHVVPDSSYEAFGTKLTIERGRLNFADTPVDNPNLDIKASRTIGDVIAGVNVGGTAKSPVLTLYSEPPMDQADILSYLTLGHPVSSASQSEGKILAGAADSAGLVGGNYLAGYFGRQFGLEEARVEARQDTQSPWVVVGKYLSPKLYIRYGVGVYENAYSVIVRYRLSKHWQVQGEGGLNSGADIIYTFERP